MRVTMSNDHPASVLRWPVIDHPILPLKKALRPLGRILLVAVVVLAVCYELRSSALQSRLLSYWASRMTYHVESGPSPRVVFPEKGPFDEALGYTRIPDFQSRLPGMIQTC